MRASEFVAEDISRRDLLKGAGALAATAAVSPAIGGEYQPWSSWKDPKDIALWDKRWNQLGRRLDMIVKKLLTACTPNMRQKLSGLSYEVGQTIKSGVHDPENNKITIDLSIYWDLSNDTIAYTVGHEMGHAYYGHSGYTSDAADNRNGELLADAFGAKLAYKAGFDPNKCFSDFNSVAKKQPGSDTHPGYKDRVDYIRQQTGITVSHINRGIQLIGTPMNQIAQA